MAGMFTNHLEPSTSHNCVRLRRSRSGDRRVFDYDTVTRDVVAHLYTVTKNLSRINRDKLSTNRL